MNAASVDSAGCSGFGRYGAGHNNMESCEMGLGAKANCERRVRLCILAVGGLAFWCTGCAPDCSDSGKADLTGNVLWCSCASPVATVQICNRGGGTATVAQSGEILQQWRFSVDACDDNLSAQVQAGQSLAPGECMELNAEVNDGTCLTRSVTLAIDPDDVLDECDEGNNEIESPCSGCLDP